jgi:hypothetical protein
VWKRLIRAVRVADGKKSERMETHRKKILRKAQKSWKNDVKNDLYIMKIYDWKDCIQDRHKWKKIVEKAKTFNDSSCRA